MGKIREDEIEALRIRADITDVIGRYLPIQRQGKSYRAVCPFHDDHDPSLHISPEKQIYKCFVCGAGGNVFTFVQRFEKISFIESVEHVADLVGFQLSEKPTKETVKKNPHLESLHQVLQETIRYTMYQLNTPEAHLEKKYLNERGLSEQICEKYEIGYHPGNDALYQFLHAKGYSDQDMVETNIVRITENGLHDVFGNRITFPIHDMYGNPIGFSARSIIPGNPAKYINTNNTKLFQKGEIIYNYHRAKASARKEGRIYVCEGVTDVIAFARAGIDHCVCTLGTACTRQQLLLLKSIAAKIVFCYDGDKAGQAATWRAAKMAQELGCTVGIISNLTGHDPDELIQRSGPEGLIELLKKEITWMEFVFQYLKQNTSFHNYSEKKEFAMKVEAELNQVKDVIDRQYFIDELFQMTGIRINPESHESTVIKPKHIASRIVLPDGKSIAERLILSQMMASAAATRYFEEKIGYLPNPLYNMLAMLIVNAYRNGKVSASSLIDEADSQELQDLIADLASNIDEYIEFDQALMDGLIRKILISIKRAQADAFCKQLEQPMNDESRKLLMNEYSECLRDLRRYIDEENSQ